MNVISMSDDKITYSDVEEYEKFFSLLPPFLLERFAKKNTNLVLKFKSQVQSLINGLNENEKIKLDIVLNTDTDELQGLMNEAYEHVGKKQYKILANPNYKEFVETNLNELHKMVNPQNQISDEQSQ